MNAERTRRVSAQFAPEAGTPPNPSLCPTCVEILDVGAGISILSGHDGGPVCSSSERVRRLEDLQFSLGEGPSHVAYATDAPIAEPDIANMTNSRWPSYTSLAIELGVCAVWAYPLHVGVEAVGVLTSYQDTVGMLTDEQNADRREFAWMVPALMTAVQARAPQPLLAWDLIDAEAHRLQLGEDAPPQHGVSP